MLKLITTYPVYQNNNNNKMFIFKVRVGWGKSRPFWMEVMEMQQINQQDQMPSCVSQVTKYN